MASKDLTRYYKIQPHERGKIKRLWTSNNHCDESLCEVGVIRRKETVKTVQGLDLSKRSKHRIYYFEGIRQL